MKRFSPLTLVALTGVLVLGGLGTKLLSDRSDKARAADFERQIEGCRARVRWALDDLRYADAIQAAQQMLQLYQDLPASYREDHPSLERELLDLRDRIPAIQQEEGDRVQAFVYAAERLQGLLVPDAARELLARHDWLDKATQGPVQKARDLRKTLEDLLRVNSSPAGGGPAEKEFKRLMDIRQYRKASALLTDYQKGCRDPLEAQPLRQLAADLQVQARHGLADLVERCRTLSFSLPIEFVRALFEGEIESRFKGVLSRREFDEGWAAIEND